MVLIYLIPGTVFFIPGSFAYLMSFSVEKALKKFLVSNADDPKQYEHMWFMDQDEKENIHFKDYFRSGNRK
ncbi:hypothetical protein SAMN02745687_00251 [Lachnospiraceae bacterium NK3A20]|nr:hypothetical protein SAMN02745687_00251 [Lachnospiraceae bacterium NK3A20]